MIQRTVRAVAAMTILVPALGLGLGLASTAVAKPGIPGAVKAGPPRFAEDAPLVEAINGAWRPTADKARDRYRHPLESLTFWGLRPGTVVVDLQPGGGYWTQIIAPYERLTGGRYIAGVADLNNLSLSEGGRKGRADFAAKFADEKVYGKVELVNFGVKSTPFLAPGTADLVITSRELHNWEHGQALDKILGDAFAALKPGGYLAVEDHRADGAPNGKAVDGYIATATVVNAAKKAGFTLDAASEINANPKDTKDYPFGVWTLPPTRQSSADGKPADPAFDHARYDAIGESDRMTLRFKKPG